MATADIKLSANVVGVDSSDLDGKEQAISVTTASGQVLSFDEVVITCPLGWLKRSIPSFTPPLPPRIIEAIENISYGRLEKVYFTFSEAFWHHTDSVEEPGPFSLQWLPPNYTDQNHQKWSIECVDLSTLPRGHADATLLFYIHGPCAEHVTSLIRALDPNSERFYEQLTTFFLPYYSRLKGFDPLSNSCKPTSIVATDWQNDEFSGWGSYVRTVFDLPTSCYKRSTLS